ncbi:TetR/AcrR family transcriptional regulator [Motiliproteus coralliicola]|uniref:TetR/AcrR family transcriptional regulator n=1 Tax=Motiliproteus coralliicola TaxID=2283196 RepID=A0A369WCX6_9GAMM|nr:TetR/AcrR family transcriptional regulator [Motiliproteus coralliicola]RDE19029.1 TetR/AcrR family transcriptional regulator [Motiliproteus coralliicola]
MSPRALDQHSLKQRELEIIEAALRLLEQVDVSQLTMDKVVAQVPYSKGTVYSHFSGKEDLLAAIGNYAMQTMADLFGRAAASEGNSRERYLGMSFAYLVYALLKPTLFRVALCSKSPSVIGKTSPERLTEHERLETTLMGLFFEVIDAGIAEGSLQLPPHLNKQQISFLGWAGGYGAIMLLNDDLNQCGGRHGLYLEREYYNASNIFMDGLGWQPLSSEYDYRQVINALMEGRFAAEIEEIRQRGRQLVF